MDPVPRGKEFQAAVVVKINPGYHMNSHKPSDSYLIPTTLTPQLPDGFTLVGEPSYPLGKNEKFPFSPDKPLNVYTDSVTFRLKMTADEKAALGKASIPGDPAVSGVQHVGVPAAGEDSLGTGRERRRGGEDRQADEPRDFPRRRNLPASSASARRPFSISCDVIAGTAFRSRSTTRFWPRATIISKSGGATARPTIATRVALISRPAFTPSPAATAARDAAVARIVVPIPQSLEGSSASFASMAGKRSSPSPEFFASLGVVTEIVGKKPRAQLVKSPSRRVRGRIRSTARANHAGSWLSNT